MIKLENVEKTYGFGESSVRAVDCVNVEFDSDRIYSVMGKSGCGKSTLLSLIGGLNPPTAGRIICDGIDVYKLGENKLAKYRSVKIGFIYQSYQLIPELTVLQNVILPLLIQKKKVDYDNVRVLLDRLDIIGKEKQYPGELSGGQQQRAAIARAFIANPEILLCDEPTGNLDNSTSKHIIELIVDIVHEHKKTAIIVTHDSEVAMMCDKRYIMKDGKIYYES